jgi:cytidylate kinase
MEVNQQTIAAMRAVTVSREYGSGGGEIAARLAQRLGWRLVDHEVIAQVARELGISETLAEAHDEQVERRITRILQRLRLSVSGAFTAPVAGAPLGAPFLAASSSPAVGNPSLAVGATSPPPEQLAAYQDTLRYVVQAAARAGHAVIVGRGGQVILAGQRDVLHVRVVAPFAQRVAYVARREGLDEAAARARTQQKDQARTRYMQTQFQCQHDNPRLYDLVINTGLLDLDSAVDLIYIALERKASRLSMPAAELGPAAGMTRYAGQPADFPVPLRPS